MKFFFSFFVKCQNEVYASNREANGLFIQRGENEMEFLEFFPKEDIWGRFLFSDCIVVNHKLIFVPAAASHIYIYDVVNKKFEVIDIKLDVWGDNYIAEKKFLCAKQLEGYIYFVPDTYPFVIRMDRKSGIITYINKTDMDIADSCRGELEERIINGYSDKTKWVYLCSTETDVVFLHKESMMWEREGRNVFVNKQTLEERYVDFVITNFAQYKERMLREGEFPVSIAEGESYNLYDLVTSPERSEKQYENINCGKEIYLFLK